MILFLKGKNFELGSKKEDEETLIQSPLLGAYSSGNFRNKKTLREEEPAKRRITPVRQGEGGRFSFRGD